MSLFLLFFFFLSIFVLSFVVVMGFVPDVGGVVMGFLAGCRFCCDGFCGRLWVRWWWVLLALVVVGFMASCGCGYDGFFFFPPLFCGGDVFCAGCRCGSNGFCGWLWVLLCWFFFFFRWWWLVVGCRFMVVAGGVTVEAVEVVVAIGLDFFNGCLSLF